MISLPVLLLSLLAAPPAGPAPRQGGAAERWQALVDRFADAQAIDVDARAALTTTHEGEETEISYRVEIHAARPLAGEVRMTVEGPAGEQGQLQIADGETVWALDEEARTYREVASSWSYLSGIGLLPLVAWSGLDAEPDSPELLRDDEHPGLVGLRARWEETEQTFWLDAEGRPVSATLDIGGSVWRYTFARFEALAEADPAGYVRAIPEGYEPYEDPADEFEADLLDVGDEAPAVRVTDLEGRAIELASLRGKTVLLNFWFYT